MNLTANLFLLSHFAEDIRWFLKNAYNQKNLYKPIAEMDAQPLESNV